MDRWGAELVFDLVAAVVRACWTASLGLLSIWLCSAAHPPTGYSTYGN